MLLVQGLLLANGVLPCVGAVLLPSCPVKTLRVLPMRPDGLTSSASVTVTTTWKMVTRKLLCLLFSRFSEEAPRGWIVTCTLTVPTIGTCGLVSDPGDRRALSVPPLLPCPGCSLLMPSQRCHLFSGTSLCCASRICYWLYFSAVGRFHILIRVMHAVLFLLYI